MCFQKASSSDSVQDHKSLTVSSQIFLKILQAESERVLRSWRNAQKTTRASPTWPSPSNNSAPYPPTISSSISQSHLTKAMSDPRHCLHNTLSLSPSSALSSWVFVVPTTAWPVETGVEGVLCISAPQSAAECLRKRGWQEKTEMESTN